MPVFTDVGDGPPVLFVHGQPGLGADFDPVARLLRADHRILQPDRPGYGRSGGEALSMHDNALVLAELLREAGAAPATVVGHSYGGGIAILLAALRPDLVSALVLAGSVGSKNSLSAFDRVLAAPAVGEVLGALCLFTFGTVLPKVTGAGALSLLRLPRLRAGLPDSTYLDGAGAGRGIWRSFVTEQRALLEEIGNVEASLVLLRAPTVVISGEWDFVVPPSVGRDIASAVAGAQLVKVERVGHFLPRDAPEVIARAVRTAEARAEGTSTER